VGELTIIGYLAWKYGQQHPICLRARFRNEEESYSGGSSASAAELFALLSALACVPIYRSFAVTGVAGQHGQVQAIGGVNLKIEGFYELGRRRRAAGDRPMPGHCGMLIPKSNAQDLMLRTDVVQAIVKEGWFKLWAIETIDDGLPLLMGFPREQINAFHERVRARLDEFSEVASPANRSRKRELPRISGREHCD
jgi:predicted ATP-dependent protease